MLLKLTRTDFWQGAKGLRGILLNVLTIVKQLSLALPEPVQAFGRYYVSRQYRWLSRATRKGVASGPFQGMRYVHRSVGSGLRPKLLGTYEKELWPAIEEIGGRGYKVIANVGAAEGYYAVGLARLLPDAQVVCFETQTKEHQLLLKLAALNGVENQITMHALCTPELLQQTLAKASPTLIVCDIDGGEYALLDPARVPALGTSDILLEIHDFEHTSAPDQLRALFENTHDIEVILGRERTLADWPLKLNFSPEEKLASLAEGRPDLQDWFWMKTRTRA